MVRRFRVSDWTDDDMADYLETLEDLSPELMMLAVKRCIQRCEFFPRVAEIRKQIADELADELARRRIEDAERAQRFREQLVALPAPERKPLTPEELVAHEARMVKIRQIIAEKQQSFVVDKHDLAEPGPSRSLSEIAASMPPFRLRAPDDPVILAALKEMEEAEAAIGEAAE